MPKTTRLKRILRALLIATLVLAGCELAARFVVPGGQRAAVAERADFLGRIPGVADRDGAGADSAASDGAAAGEDRGGHDDGAPAVVESSRMAVLQAFGSRFQVHPFFGYTFAPGLDGANNQGFFAGGARYPYVKEPGQVVIGVFGGSVAMQSVAAQESLSAPLRERFAELGFDRVRVLSFASGGWRQPQSFFALVYFLRSIDVAIVLDGFNEVIHVGDAELAQYPASYPWSAVYAPLVRGLGSPEEVMRAAEIVEANREAAQMTSAFQRAPLRWSTAAHLVWRVFARRYEERVAPLRSAAQQDSLAGFAAIDPPPAGDLAAKRDAYLQSYEDVIYFSDLVTRASGKPFFHFVQPNQYDRGSKPLSDEERERFTTNSGWFDLVTQNYERLEEMSERLRAKGVESYYLGDIFEGIADTLYSDECCHMNDRGLGMLNRAMAERILAAPSLERSAGPHQN